MFDVRVIVVAAARNFYLTVGFSTMELLYRFAVKASSKLATTIVGWYSSESLSSERNCATARDCYVYSHLLSMRVT